MNVRILLLAAATAVALGGCAKAAAPAPTASGSVVVDGRTYPLAHGRAWRRGAVMGVPEVEIMLADAPLDGIDWWKQQEAIEGGKHGRVLNFEPSQVPENTKDKEPYKYVIENGYEVSVSAPEFGNRSTATMTDKPQLVNITVSAGWVEGEVTWTGAETAGYDPVQTLSGYSAKFKLPLEDLPEMPKE